MNRLNRRGPFGGRVALLVSVAAVALALAGAAFPASSGAATFPVSSNADAGANTLRAAIDGANGNGTGETDQIPISVTGTIDLVSALPTIDTPTTITGPGRTNLTVRRTGASAFRVFSIATASSADTVEIRDLTIADGQAPGSSGGGVRVSGAGTAILRGVALNGNSAQTGGGLENDGSTVRILDSVINDNAATVNGAGASNNGGLEVTRSTLTLNDSAVNAGAISTGNAPGHTLLIINTTIATNTANGVGGGIGQFNGVVTVISSTIADNSSNFDNTGSEAGGGTASFSSADFSVVNTIYAGNESGSGGAATPNQCGGLAHESLGYNLRTSADAGCTGFGGPGEVVTASPLLGPIGDYGGPTRTIALLPGSPAIDAASPTAGIFDPTQCPPTDQRGQPRRGAAGRCDIGAFELQPQAGDTTPPETTIVSGPRNKTRKRRARFQFISSEPGSTFQCSVDRRAPRPCASGRKFKVKKGKHSFEVGAIDPAGNADPTPAVDRWKVKKKKRKRKR